MGVNSYEKPNFNVCLSETDNSSVQAIFKFLYHSFGNHFCSYDIFKSTIRQYSNMSAGSREEQINFLQKIKPMFLFSQLPTEENEKKIVNNNQETSVKLDELIQRIESLEKALDNQQEEGVRKGKIKDSIASLLQQNKRLTSSQLSKLIGLSRTRCSEYFRELTREGKTEGVIINRQKYYKFVGK